MLTRKILKSILYSFEIGHMLRLSGVVRDKDTREPITQKTLLKYFLQHHYIHFVWHVNKTTSEGD